MAEMITDCKEIARMGKYGVQIVLVGLGDEGPTLELVSAAYANAPKHLEHMLQ